MPMSPSLAALIQAISDPQQADQISLMLATRAAPPAIPAAATRAATGTAGPGTPAPAPTLPAPAPAPVPAPAPTLPQIEPPGPEGTPPSPTNVPMPAPPEPAQPPAPPGGGVFSGVGTEFAKSLLAGPRPLTVTPNAPAAVAGARGLVAPPFDPYQYLIPPGQLAADRLSQGQRPMSLGQLILGRQ